jgi:DNA polymerase IIIc chi subunit
MEQELSERTRAEQEAGRRVLMHITREERAGVFENSLWQRCKRFRPHCSYRSHDEMYEFWLYDPVDCVDVIPMQTQHANVFPTNELLMQIELVAK